MSLYERGKFQLSDPVARFIPAWAGLKVREVAADGTKSLVDPHRPMTVRDAMMHMTGLGWGGRRTPFATATSPLAEGAAGGMAAALANPLDADWTLETLMERLAERPLRFHPGTHWFYSVSTDVCARLVEIISGQRFDEYLNEEIFEPLGMVDTGFIGAGREDRPLRRQLRTRARQVVATASRIRWRAATANPARSSRAAAASSPPRPTTCASRR